MASVHGCTRLVASGGYSGDGVNDSGSGGVTCGAGAVAVSYDMSGWMGECECEGACNV